MTFFLLSFLLHGYLGVRLVPALVTFPVVQGIVLTLVVVSAVLMPLSLFGRRLTGRGRVSKVLVWLGLLFMGLFSSLFVLTFLRDVALLAVWAAQGLWPGMFDLHAFETLSALGVAGAGLLTTLWGFVNARRTAAVVRVDVPIAGLPAALEGFTVAQISDVHVGPTIRRSYLERIVRAVNALKVDMVAITGDLVDGRVQELSAHVAPLSALSSRHGTYFVTGNHEYYSGADAWIGELRRLGIHVLLNQHVVLQHGDAQGSAPLVVAGVADFGAHHFDPEHRSDPAAALAGAPTHARMRMLLAHQPRSAPAAARAGYQLQLSGHTHGGQFFPWNLFVRLQQPFTAGLHRLQNLWVYTSRGTGYWGPPKRFGAPSEITHLRLVAA
jgi:uncharacterized protein